MKYLLTLALHILVLSGMSQGVMTGFVTDSVTRKPLAFATISVYTVADTSLITFRMSNTDGKFRVTDIPTKLPLRLLVSYAGYSVFRKEFTITEGTSLLNLDTIRLSLGARSLEEVLVTAEIPPVIYRNDTIEYNASSFKTLPTALVEDLLKKLPGVLVSPNGEVYVNGKVVNRILVDGKTFFGDDPKMATRNLPANIIDKVQVMDDDEQLMYNPGISSNDLGKVISLKLKKAVKKQIFGRVAAGIGNKDRKEGSMIFNHFRDTLQASILGFGNNTNRPAFGYTELRDMGGFKRSGTRDLSVRTGGGILINNISLGGTEEGILEAVGGGINVNNDFKNGINFNIQYFYGHTRNNFSTSSSRIQFLEDSILQNDINANSIKKVDNHRISSIIKWTSKDKIRLEFRPSVNIANQNNDLLANYVNTNLNKEPTGISINSEQNKAHNWSYTHSFLFFKPFKKKGRYFSVTQNINTNEVFGRRNNNVTDSIFSKNGLLVSNKMQQRDRDNNFFNTGIILHYNEPLNKKYTLKLTNNAIYFNGIDGLNTYGFNTQTNNFDQFDSSLSSDLRRKLFSNILTGGIDINFNKVTLNVSANYIRYDISDALAADKSTINSAYNYVQPGVEFRWKDISFAYSGKVNPPALSDILPVTDNSNSLYIFRGNKYLNPVLNRSLTFSYFKYYPSKSLSTNVYITNANKKGEVIYAREIDSQGVQISYPVNAGTTLNEFVGFLFISKQLKISTNSSINIQGSFSYINDRRFVQVNNLQRPYTNIELFPNFKLSLNLNDVVELSTSINQSWRKTIHKNDVFPNAQTRILRSFNEIVLRLGKHFVWESSADYQYNSSGVGLNSREVLLWNSSLTWLFLQENRAQLKFYAFDILNRNIAFGQSVSENYIYRKSTILLNQFFMITLYYDIRGIKSKDIGGRKQLLLF